MRAAGPVFPNNDPPVILGRFGDSVIVRSKLKPPLTKERYLIVKALLEAGEFGLTKDELDAKSQSPEARKILKRLRDSDSDWVSVIHMAGKKGHRYRIS